MTSTRALLASAALSLSLTACGSPFTVEGSGDPADPTWGEDVTWTFDISDDDGAVEGAAVDLVPWMVEHGHGTNGDITVEELGNGQYESTFQFSMAGEWELQLHVAEGGREGDHVIPVTVQ